MFPTFRAVGRSTVCNFKKPDNSNLNVLRRQRRSSAISRKSTKANSSATNKQTITRPTAEGAPKNNHSPLKFAVGASAGILIFCGLDFVAPTEYPFGDSSSSSDTKEKTYWNDTARSPGGTLTSSTATKRSKLAPSDSPEQCQVVIVGGGMAGLHTALALSERQNGQNKGTLSNHNNILILDAGRVGQGASGKSKGLAVPGIQVPEEDLAHQCGSKEISEQVYKLTYEALRRLKHDIVQKYKIDCDWVDAGLVEASLHEDNAEEDDDDADDDGCRALTASEVRTMLGQPQSSSLYKCGEYDPSCSGVNPLALTRGLAHVLEGQGVRICEKTKAAKIEKAQTKTDQQRTTQLRDAYKYVVTTESGAQIYCQHVVLCTGPDLVSKELSRQLANAVIPIYTWMASTVPLGDQCPLQGDTIEAADGNKKTQATMRKPAPLCGDDFVSLNYWRRTEDGRLLFGSLADAYPIPQWLAEYRLRQAMREVYPQLADVRFEHVWGGILAFSRDAVPLIGRDEGFDDKESGMDPSKGGVWYATGFGGHGIVPTVMAGSIIADGILGLDDDTWRLFQREFPPRYNFWPVSRLGAEAILMLYNAFDWLHVRKVPVPRLPKPW